jgi:hypothetical protein
VDGILTREQIQKLIGLCWNAEKLSDAGDIARAAVPGVNLNHEAEEYKPRMNTNEHE